MATFEWIIVLLLGAALLAALARRLGAPYPTFLALGGALLAFVPASPNWTLDPRLALTLFYAPVFLLTVFGSLAAGVACGHLIPRLTNRLHDVPISLVVQFACIFGVWIAAEAIGLSGILTLVAFAITIARRGGPQMPARMRVSIFAVWETVVFVLNAFAFVLIGMQLRPIWGRLDAGGARTDAVITAAVVLGVTIAARFAWVMAYNALMRKRHDRAGAGTGKGARPTVGSGIVVSWAGMRGIVTLAAAFAIPETLPNGSPFPYRDLILLCAFAVVLGTLVLQGLTLKPLIRRMRLTDDDPVSREIRLGRTHAYHALLDAIKDDETLAAKLLRKEYGAVVELNSSQPHGGTIDDVPGGPLRRRAIAVARQRAFELRRDDVIGDDAYRVLVQELDWAELSAGGGRL